MLRTKRIALAGLALASLASSAHASFLDTDFWCRTYGCAVVHDGVNYDIYDNYQFASNSCCVPVGGQMIDFYVRAGNTNVTGLLGGTVPDLPDSDGGFMFGITRDGSSISASVIDDGDGFLDAGDVFGAFTLNPNTDIILDGPGRAYSHSFFILSRGLRFSLRALVSITNATGDLANIVELADIKHKTSFCYSGTSGCV